jgi:Xaa-Pro aminopeptidase
MKKFGRVVILIALVSLMGAAPGLALYSRPDGDAQLTQEAKRRRAELMTKLGSTAMFILISAESRNFERDVDYEFRQDSNLFYLTGIDQQGITLVLMPGNQSPKEMLFLPERDAARELWTGKMLSQQEASAMSGIETIYAASQFDAFLDAALNGRPFGNSAVESQAFFDAVGKGEASVYLVLENRPGPPAPQSRPTRQRQLADQLKSRFANLQIKDAAAFLYEMRLVKSAYELKQLRQAVDISCIAQREAMKAVKPGMYEYEIEALIEYIFRKSGAPWPGYPSIVGSGPNATTLHYDKSSRQMKAGDLLLIDAGAEYNYYSADVTRTFPVNGKFSPPQAEIYHLVLEAQIEAMKVIKPGATIPQVHQRAVEVLKDGLLKLGLITDKSGEQYRLWFPHGTCHFLGMNVHDVGARNAPFKPGVVFTVEPGLYIRQDTWENLRRRDEKLAAAIEPALRKYQGIGVRIEDDVVVTETGFELLSEKAPRTLADVEALMRR